MKNFRRPRWLPRRRTSWEKIASGAQTINPAADLSLTIIVVCYKMDGQIANTLRSLSVPYQRDIESSDYEILVVDNGSLKPLNEAVWNIAGNIQYQHIPPAEAKGNPGIALNRAVARARGKIVCLMIDGARMLTPGALAWGVRLCAASRRAMVEVRGWHLGPKMQMDSVLEGYNSEVERALLASIDWQNNGYRLFEISVPAQSSGSGFLGKSTETTCAFMTREMYQNIAGYDERYAEPGGGLANFDFFWRATQAADVVFTLLGEGTFHQIHGGASTGLSAEDRRAKFRAWREEYEKLSRRFANSPPPYEPALVGHLPAECIKWLTLDSR